MEDSRSIRCEADAYERDIPVVSSSLREIPIIPDNFGKTSQVKQMKSFSSSRTKAHKSFSSLSDSNGQLILVLWILMLLAPLNLLIMSIK